MSSPTRSKGKTAILVSLALAMAMAGGLDEDKIKLPKDLDDPREVSETFKLRVELLEQTIRDWEEVATKAMDIINPRRPTEDTPVVDANLYEETQSKQNDATANESTPPSYEPLSPALQRWIEVRASTLADKVDRYFYEVTQVKEPKRIVVQILLLNTLVDLENLAKENIRGMKWIKNKVKAMQKYKGSHEVAVENFVLGLIGQNIKIESKIRGTNKPGEKWITNTQALKKILHEQRFSSSISERIVNFLGGEFSMMQRSRVFDLNRLDKRLSGGLQYTRADGIVPSYFPFSAQDAIANGAQF